MMNKVKQISWLRLIEYLIVPIGLISIIYLFWGENILIWLNKYFNFSTNLEFINNLNNILYNFSLSIISGLIIYFFTGYIPEQKDKKKFNIAYFRSIESLYREIKNLNYYYENYNLCIKKDKENFKNLNVQILVPEPCTTDKDWEYRFYYNIKHSEVKMQGLIKLIDDKINEINSINLVFFHDYKMQEFISIFKKEKSISENYKTPKNMELYYKCIIDALNEICGIYSYEYITKKCRFNI